MAIILIIFLRINWPKMFVFSWHLCTLYVYATACQPVVWHSLPVQCRDQVFQGQLITPHTVVWECCKDDQQSQWEMPNFGVCSLQNPLVDFQKNLQGWLRRGPRPTCKYWGQSVQRGRVCACVKLSPSGRRLFFSFLDFMCLATGWIDRCRYTPFTRWS